MLAGTFGPADQQAAPHTLRQVWQERGPVGQSPSTAMRGRESRCLEISILYLPKIFDGHPTADRPPRRIPQPTLVSAGQVSRRPGRLPVWALRKEESQSSLQKLPLSQSSTLNSLSHTPRTPPLHSSTSSSRSTARALNHLPGSHLPQTPDTPSLIDARAGSLSLETPIRELKTLAMLSSGRASL